MSRKRKSDKLFHKYFEDWIALYKEGAVREVTLNKYYMTLKRVEEIAPNLKLSDLDRQSYQMLLNTYAVTHEKQTTMDFHHQLKSAILDAVDEGLLNSNPTRKVIIKGKKPSVKKVRFLNQYELQTLLKFLELNEDISWDWFILLIAKTGIRFSEALALTPSDFNFATQMLNIDKTWNYKSWNGYQQETKNESSKRKVLMDWQIAMQFSQLVKGMDPQKPIFVNGRVYNSIVNKRLEKLCVKSDIPVISVHGLRHTHASMLLFAGVSIASVAKRLGHSSMITTQETYLHIIKELDKQDSDKIIRHLSSI